MSIFVKIFLTISIFTSIFIALFDTYIIDIERSNSIERLNNKITYNELIYKNTISQLLFDYNKDILYSNLNSLYLDPEIVKIEIIDYSTVLDFKLDTKQYNINNIIKNNFELVRDGQLIGKLNILYTKDIINAHLQDYENNLIQYSILLVLLLFVIIFFIIYKFTKSIKQLTTAATKITSGDLSFEITIKSNDEIGTLSKEFESMRKSLINRIEVIEQQLVFQQLLMDTVSVPIYIKDINLNYIGFNKAFLDYFGYKKEEILGKSIIQIKDTELTRGYDLDDKEILLKGDSNIFNTKIYNANRELRDVILFKNTFSNMSNKIDGIVGTVIDITELNNVTKELNEINKTLEEKIKDRTEDLEKSNDELEQTISNLIQTQKMLVEAEKMASLGGLVAGVAHELNTPVGNGLMGITHFLQISKKLEKDYANEIMTQSDFEEFIKITTDLAQQININLKKTALLVKNFKQVSVDQTSEQKREFNIKLYLEEIIYSLNYLIKQTRLKVTIHCDDNIELNSYPGAYSQILTNLITNSIRHAFEKQEEGLISINVQINPNNHLEITYKDNGKGISKENLSKIFDPFFTTNREDGGTGLGLNIVYNIVMSTLKGTIECNSIGNEGVTFIIILPL
ncbi:hypothetical protein A9Q76_07970 [Arcobacter sp. 31_11_sub10_T18]|nr:hypothetical protein A9Q76_07970 [Arcobacter sp. 31_11_sub10_T18]